MIKKQAILWRYQWPSDLHTVFCPHKTFLQPHKTPSWSSNCLTGFYLRIFAPAIPLALNTLNSVFMKVTSTLNYSNAIIHKGLCWPPTKICTASPTCYPPYCFFLFMLQNPCFKFIFITEWVSESWKFSQEYKALEHRQPHSLGCKEQRCSIFSCHLTFQDLAGQRGAIIGFDWVSLRKDDIAFHLSHSSLLNATSYLVIL